MEKEEKKAELEQLLNSLIEKGWKPFNRYYEGMKVTIRTHENYQGLWYDMDVLCEDQYGDKDGVTYKPRQVVSKESGLWQFVCENGMIKKSIISREYFNTLGGCRITFRDENMAFWLIESSLKDESELEDFLLSNIVIKDEN